MIHHVIKYGNITDSEVKHGDKQIFHVIIPISNGFTVFHIATLGRILKAQLG